MVWGLGCKVYRFWGVGYTGFGLRVRVQSLRVLLFMVQVPTDRALCLGMFYCQCCSLVVSREYH